MNIRPNSKRKGGATTSIIVENINVAGDRPVSDDLLVGYAMHACGENPSSLFGYSVHRYPDDCVAIVNLHTD